MKVLIVNTSEHTGGAAVAANRLMKALALKGVECKMMVRDKTSDDDRVVNIGSRFRKLPLYLEKFVIWTMNGFSRKELFTADLGAFGLNVVDTPEFREADVIHLHWVNQGMISLGELRRILRSGKPVVWTMHDLWSAVGICHHPRTCENFHFSCGNCQFLRFPFGSDVSRHVLENKRSVYAEGPITFVACSQWLKGVALKGSLLRNARIESIPNPVDTSVFCRTDKCEARARFGLPSDKKLIMFCSVKISDVRKGIHYFIESCNMLRDRGADGLEVVIMGSKAEQFRDLIPFKVHFLGYVSDEQTAAQAYNAADIFVTPSLDENLPNTVMESLACGTPCVGFRTGGIPEMVDHKVNGYVARYMDSADLADGIEWCLDESRYSQLSDEALRKVDRCYSQTVIADQFTGIYKELTDGKKN